MYLYGSGTKLCVQERLDSDGDLELSFACQYDHDVFLNKDEAIRLIAHLENLFGINNELKSKDNPDSQE